jgi:excisionase family DNA binding protein
MELNNQLIPMNKVPIPEAADSTLSTREVARVLKISEHTLRQWIAAKKIIGFFRIGRGWRIRQQDLEELIGQKISEISNL